MKIKFVIIVLLVGFLFLLATPVAAQTPPGCTVNITNTVSTLPLSLNGGEQLINNNRVYMEGTWLVIEATEHVYRENAYLGASLALGNAANKTIFTVNLADSAITYTQYIVIEYLDKHTSLYAGNTTLFGLANSNTLPPGTYQRSFKKTAWKTTYDDFFVTVDSPNTGLRDEAWVRLRIRITIVPQTCPMPPLQSVCPGGIAYNFTEGLTPWSPLHDDAHWDMFEADGAAKIGTTAVEQLTYSEPISPGVYAMAVRARSYAGNQNPMTFGVMRREAGIAVNTPITAVTIPLSTTYHLVTTTVVYTDGVMFFTQGEQVYNDYICLYYQGNYQDNRCAGGTLYDFTEGLTPWASVNDTSSWYANESNGVANVGFDSIDYIALVTDTLPGTYLVSARARTYSGDYTTLMQIGHRSGTTYNGATSPIVDAEYEIYTATVPMAAGENLYLRGDRLYVDYVCILDASPPPTQTCEGGTLYDFSSGLTPWQALNDGWYWAMGEENGAAGVTDHDHLLLADLFPTTYHISAQARAQDDFPTPFVIGFVDSGGNYQRASEHLLTTSYALYTGTVSGSSALFLWGNNLYVNSVCVQMGEADETCDPFPEFPGWTLELDVYFNWIGDIIKWLWCNLEYWLRKIWLTLRSLTFADIVREFLETVSQLWLWLKERWTDLQALLGFELPDIFAILEEFWNIYIQPKWEALWQWLQDLEFPDILAILEEFWNIYIQPKWEALWQWLQALEFPDILAILTNFWNTYLKPVLDGLMQLLTNIWNVIAAIPGIIRDILLAILNGIWNALLALPAWLWNLIWPILQKFYDVVMALWFALQQLWAMRHIILFPFKWLYLLLTGVFSAFWFSIQSPPAFGGPIWQWFVELMSALRTTPPFNYIIWVMVGIIYATVIQDVLDEVKEL